MDQILHSLNHLCLPSLDSLQFACFFLGLKIPELVHSTPDVLLLVIAQQLLVCLLCFFSPLIPVPCTAVIRVYSAFHVLQNPLLDRIYHYFSIPCCSLLLLKSFIVLPYQTFPMKYLESFSISNQYINSYSFSRLTVKYFSAFI